MTAAEFLLACKVRGLSIAEIDELNLGTIIDYIYAYDDVQNGSQVKDDKARIATQDDFNSF